MKKYTIPTGYQEPFWEAINKETCAKLAVLNVKDTFYETEEELVNYYIESLKDYLLSSFDVYNIEKSFMKELGINTYKNILNNTIYVEEE